MLFDQRAFSSYVVLSVKKRRGRRVIGNGAFTASASGERDLSRSVSPPESPSCLVLLF